MKPTGEPCLDPARRAKLPGWRESVSAIALTALLASAPVHAQDQDEDPQGDQPGTESDVEIIQVTGYRSSLSTSQAIKREAEVVVDSITAEDIGALPDRSVTEALQRVPGVSIDRFRAGVDPDHFSIEGSGVVVRGLTWVRSELNGRDTFSANNGRILSFSDVPAELMGGVDVFKSPSADMIEGGISGTINLRTRRPFDGAPTLAASVEASYGDFAEEWTPTYSVLASERWDTGQSGEFGLLFNFVNSELTARSDGQQISNYGERTLYSNGDVVPTDPSDTEVGTIWFPRGAAFRSQVFERERQGIGAAAQWRSEDRTMEATLQFLRSDSQQAWTEHAMEIATDNVQNNGDSRAVLGTQLDFGSNGLFTSGVITSDNTGWRSDQNGADARTPAEGLQSNNIRRDVVQDYLTEDIGFNFKWTPNDSWSFNFDYQHVESEVDVLDVGMWASTYQNVAVAVSGDSIPWVVFSPPGLDGTPCAGDPGTAGCPGYYRSPHDSFSDPFNSFPRAVMDHMERSEGTLDAFRADGEYHFNNADRWAESFRFGYRYANRDQVTRFSTYNWGAVSEQWSGAGPTWLDQTVPGVGQLSDYFETYGFDNFMRGKVPVPTGDEPRLFWSSNIINDYETLSNFATTVSQNWRPTTTCENWEPLAARCGEFADGTPFLLQEVNPIQETSHALYGMLRFSNDLDNGVQVSGNFGLRYVDMTRETQGYHSFTQVAFATETDCADVTPGQTPPAFCELSAAERAAARAFADGSITPNQTSHDMEYYLPSFNVVARLDNGWQFRFGASKTITLPDVGLTRNYYNVTLQSAEYGPNGDLIGPSINSTVGNPYLDPIESLNFDASAEWYFADVGSLTFALFYKELDNVITNGTERLSFTNNGATFDGLVTTPVNADEQGTVKGFEIAYQQTYDMLPAPFDGLGMNASYTYVDSEGVVQSTLSATDPDVAAGRVANIDTSLLPLQGLSEHTVNWAGFYEKGPWSFRLAYAWRSDFVVTVRDVIVPYAPIIQESGGQLDGSFFYAINDNIRFGVQGVNLLNEVTRTSQVLNDDLLTAPRSWFMNDRRVTFVLRASY